MSATDDGQMTLTPHRNRAGNQWTPAMFEAMLKDVRVAMAQAGQQHGDHSAAEGDTRGAP